MTFSLKLLLSQPLSTFLEWSFWSNGPFAGKVVQSVVEPCTSMSFKYHKVGRVDFKKINGKYNNGFDLRDNLLNSVYFNIYKFYLKDLLTYTEIVAF